MQHQLEQLEKDCGIEWQEFKLEQLFGKSTRGRRLKSADRIDGDLPFVTAGEADTGISAWIGNDVHIFSANTTTIDMFGSAKYRGYKYGADDHVAVVHTEKLSRHVALFFTSAIHKSSHAGQFDYSRNFYATDADDLTIQLPTIAQNGKPQIAFDFIERFIATLQAERLATLQAERLATLQAYLSTTGLTDYMLTAEEQAALDGLDAVAWSEFSFSQLFDNIVQGRRLKKQDQIAGTMPFVMAGVTNTGVVDYIGNEVRVFPKNSLTVDIFGNIFYRSYEYGMGDDTGAYWNTDNHISKFAMLYIATTMQKFMAGKFDFGHKLRSSRSLDFKIQLPINPDCTPNYDYMTLVISAMQKVVIKNLVDYLDKRIEKTGSFTLDNKA